MPMKWDDVLKGSEGRYKSSDYEPESPRAGWGDEFGSAVDSTKAGLWGIAEAAGMDSAAENRIDNKLRAERTKQYADKQLGIAGSWDEAEGVGGTVKYLASQGMNTVPQLGITTAATLVNPALGAAAAYGFALGDTLENQRDQAGHTNMGMGMATAVPYAAADYLGGIQGKITRGLAARGAAKEVAKEVAEKAPSKFNLLGRAEQALEGKTGIGGFAGRRALEFGKTGLEEAAGETFQETMNQASRMSVDSTAGLLDDDALGRYKESAIVGGLLGGAVGTVTGGKYGAKATAPKEDETKGNTPIGEKGVEELGRGGPPRNDTVNILDPTDRNKVNQSILDYGRTRGGANTPTPPGSGPATQPLQEDEGHWSPPGTPAAAHNGTSIDSMSPAWHEGTPRGPLDFGGSTSRDETNRLLLRGGREMGGGLPTGSPVAAQVGQAVGQAFPLPQQQDTAQQTAQQQREQDQQSVRDHAESVARLTQRAAEHGVGEKEALLFGSLDAALKNGLIDKASWVVGVGNLASGNKQLIAETKKGIAALEAQHALNQQQKPAAAAAAPAGGLELGPAVQPATAGATAAPAGAQAPAAAPVEQAAQREVAAVKERLSPGRTITAGIMQRKGGKPISPLLRRRLYQRLGLDDEGWPRAEKRTLAEIAQIEADEKGEGKLEGKKLDQKARSIQTMLAGHGFPDKVINDAIDAMTDQDHSLDMRTVDPGAEERAGGAERATPATSEGLDIEDQTDFEQGMSGTAEERPEGAPEESEDQLEAGEGIGTKSSATSTADREGFVAHEFRDTSALLSRSPDLSEAQQGLFAAVAGMHYSKVKEAIETLITNEEVFSPKEREMLAFVFQQGRSDAAEERRDEAVQEARDIAGTDKTAEEALAARNIEVIAKNAREDAAKAQRAASLARQVEEMDTGDALLEAVPADMHEDIDAAAREWEEYASEGAPAWHGLATDLQAQWVKGFSASLDMTPRASQEQRVAASEAVSRRAIGRQESAAAAADRAATDTQAAIASAQRREELRGLAEKQDAEEKAKAARKAERTVGTTVVRTKKGKLSGKNTQADGGAGGTVADVGQGTEGTQQGTPASRESRDGAQDAGTAPARTGGVNQEGSQAQEPAERPANPDVDTTHGDWSNVVATAPLMAEPPTTRKPSVKVALRRANKEVATGKISEAEALQRVTEVAEAAAEHEGDKRSAAQRVRDVDHTRAKLLEARRTGDLDPDLVELADWFLRQNPQLASGLAISIESPKYDKRGNEIPGPAGTYESTRRIMTLIKGRSKVSTAVHEILHHMERMMPAAMRAAVTRAWVKALFKAKEKAYAGEDEDLKKFFDALMYYHFDEANKYGSAHPAKALEDAMKLIRSGKVSANQFYQYVNASEFWAVNGTRIVQGRFAGTDGWHHRIRAWMREFVQKLKGMLGMQSDAPIIKALDSIAKGDGKFLTGTMLAEGSGVGGVHNSYASEGAQDQHAQDQLIVANNMEGMGKSPADIRLTTGWFRNPYDNKWRFEVTDDHMALTQPLRKFNLGAGKYTLRDVMHHDELTNRYPELRDVKVEFFEGGYYGNHEGWFSPVENRIGLNRDPQGTVEDTLIHEVQHWIQNKEGLATGTSSDRVAYELNDAQAIKIGTKIEADHQEILRQYRTGVSQMEQFVGHPKFPALIAARRQAKLDMKNAGRYKGRHSLPLDKAIASMRRAEQLTEQIAADTLGMDDIHALTGLPAHGMLTTVAGANSMKDAWAYVSQYKDYNNEYEANLKAAASGNREQIARLGLGSPHLFEAYQNSAGEQEAEEVARRREMDEDFRTYFAPFPMTETGLAAEDAIVSYETVGKTARERAAEGMTRRQMLFGALASAAGMKATAANADPMIKGRAQPISARAFGARISPATEALLRGGDLRAAVRQIAEEAKDPRIGALAAKIYVKLGEGNTGIAPLKTRVDDKTVNENHAEAGINKAGEPTATFYTAKGARGLTTDTVLHEALHVTTLKAYYKAMQASKQGDEKAMRAMMEFQALHSEFIDAAEAKGYGKGLDATTRDSIAYAIGNREEFFVRSLTDPAFQKFLASMPYKGETLWDHFKYWVSKLLDGAGIEPSWLDAATLGSQRYFDAQGQGMADWHRGRKARTADSHASAKPASTRREMILNALLSLSIGGTGVGLAGKIAYDKLTGSKDQTATGPVKDETTLGRATPVSAATLKARISPAAEKLLRNGRPDNTTDTNGADALRRAIDQIAKDHPELASLAAQVKAVIPDRLLVKVDGLSSPNAHGKVTLKGVPQLTLYTYGGREGLTAATILHETLHAAVAARYHSLNAAIPRSNDKKLGGTPKAAGELAQFHKVFQEFERQMEGFKTSDEKLDLSISEALGDPDEFFVRALTDPVFQAHLATMKYEGTTLLQRFKDWVKRTLFGVTGQQASWLDAALIASGDLAESSRQDAADWKRYQAVQAITEGSASTKHSRVSTPVGERTPNETTAAYKAQNRTVLGRAIPLSPERAKSRMSAKAEKLLRAGHADGTTNPEATQAIKAALRQVARDYPELSSVVTTVLALMPEKGIALQVDGKKLMNVHGYVDFKGQPTMYLFTAENREGLTPATFVHEALHAVVGARYYMLTYGMAENNFAKLGLAKPVAMQALKDFKTFFDEFNDHVRAFVKEQGGTLANVSPQLRSSLNEAGSNPDELFVRALSDPALQQWLAQREYTGGSLLDKFKRWVSRNLFNVTTGTRPSWLDAAMTASNTLAKASKADEANWGMHQAMQSKLGGGRAGEMIPDSVTNRLIDEQVARLHPALQPGAKFGLRAITNGAKRAVTFITTTEDMTRIVEKAMPAARRYSDAMRNIVFDRQNRQLAAEQILHDSKNLVPGQREKASNFMRDSTLAKKWGFKPAYVPEAVVDEAMQAKFMALLPETRKVVEAAFEQNHKDLMEQRAAVVEAAEVAHGADEEAKNRAVAKYDRLMGMSGSWPYMPLSRFGDFTAVGRSEAFRDVEDKLRDDPTNKALRERHDEMETDPAHYEVQFGQTEAHAQAIADDMRARFPDVEHFARDQTQVLGAGGDMFGAVARLRNLAADSKISETSARTLQKLVNDLHLSLLSERSARQSDRARKGIAGFNEDMWRNFGSRAKSNAHFIASTRATGTVQNHLAQLKREANVSGTVEGMDRAERSKHYNEFMRRHMAEMEWRPNSWVDNGMATTSFWKLLTSPSYLLMNLTQPWVMSAPVIAGRHGISATFREMGRAYAELIPLVKSGELAPGKFKNMPKDVQAGIDALIRQGLISVSLEGELGKYGEGADAFIVTKGLKMMGDFLSKLSTKTEDMNRLATAIAALRLERARGAKPEDAVKYAAKVLYDTHGDYSGFNSPPWMRTKFGRLVSQFRKFQMIQVGLWFKLANDAFIGKGLTKDERWAAMKSFGYSLGTMGMLGGALGLPGAQVIALGLGAAFGDPDEPNDPEAAMRRWIGNEDLANLILKGVPAYLGVDLSSRIGAGDMLSLLPYSDPELSKAGVERMGVKLLGPAFGVLADTAEGMGMMWNGDYWKGLEKIAPRGVSDAVKGARLATQGFTNKSGETTMTADDVGVAAGVLQAVGIPTSTLTERSRGVSEKYVQDKYYTAHTAEIKKDYTDAYLGGDTAGMASQRERWTNIQAARKALGYQPSPMSDLLKAPAERAKRERQSVGGVQYRGKRDEGAARQLAEL